MGIPNLRYIFGNDFPRLNENWRKISLKIFYEKFKHVRPEVLATLKQILIKILTCADFYSDDNRRKITMLKCPSRSATAHKGVYYNQIGQNSVTKYPDHFQNFDSCLQYQ